MITLLKTHKINTNQKYLTSMLLRQFCFLFCCAVIFAVPLFSPTLLTAQGNGNVPDDLEVHTLQPITDPLASDSLIPKPRDMELHDKLLQYTLVLEPSQSERRLVISTGPSRGGYYGVGGVICSLLNHSYSRHRIECLVRPSTGSRENLILLTRGQADLAIVQSDMLANAARGNLDILTDEDEFARLRALASLYPIPAHILVHKDAGIDDISDLRGKKVAMGPENSAQRSIAAAVLTQAGINIRNLRNIDEEDHADPVNAICNQQVDAIVVVSPVPHPGLMVASSRCNVDFLPLEGDELDDMVVANPFFIKTQITAGTYDVLDRDIPTIGFAAILAVRDDLEDRVVAEVLNAIIANFTTYQSSYPSLSSATASCLTQCGMAVPLHDAVTAYLSLYGEAILPEVLHESYHDEEEHND